MWNDEDAEWYAENYGEHFSTTLAVKLANIKSSDIVLDIGCGSGNSCRIAAGLITFGQVIGIDPTPRMIKIAKNLTFGYSKQNKIKFFNASAEDIPLMNESVDVILAINSFYHWYDFKRGLVEIKRVLKPGGKFFIADQLNNNFTTNGEGELGDPKNMILFIEKKGFINTTYTKHKEKDERMIFFSSKKT